VSDIFLSYDSRDLERIKPLAAALTAQGWRVFYDRTIPPAKTWRQVIAKEIAECRCMVVAWSNHSIESDWVLEEADDGKLRKILVPFFLDNVKLPWGFREITAANLMNWEGDQADPVFVALCDSIAEIISSTDAIGDPGYGEPGNQVQVEVDRHSKEKIEAESVEQKIAEGHNKDHPIKNTEINKGKETLKKPLKDLSASVAGIHREFGGQRSEQQAIKNPATNQPDGKSERIGNAKLVPKDRPEDKKLQKAENLATGKQNQNRTIPESRTSENTPLSQKEPALNSIKDQQDPSIRRAKIFLKVLCIAMLVSFIFIIRQSHYFVPNMPLDLVSNISDTKQQDTQPPNHSIYLTPITGKIGGRVVDSQGRGIIGVKISAGGNTVFSGGSDGHFELNNISVGDQNISADRIGFQSQSQTVSVKAGGLTSVSFSLIPTNAEIRGYVEDTEGKGIDGAFVVAGEQKLRTDSRGFFFFYNLPIVEVSVSASHPNYKSERINKVVLKGGETKSLDFILSRLPASIEGTVTSWLTPDSHRVNNTPLINPLYGAKIVLGNQSVLTDKTGYFSLINVLPGKYDITVSMSGYMTDVMSDVLLKGGEKRTLNFVLSLLPGSLEGKVTYYDLGEVIPKKAVVGAKVTLGNQFALTDASGSYKLNNVAPGTYEIKVNIAGTGEMQSKVITINGAGTLQTQNFHFPE